MTLTDDSHINALITDVACDGEMYDEDLYRQDLEAEIDELLESFKRSQEDVHTC